MATVGLYRINENSILASVISHPCALSITQPNPVRKGFNKYLINTTITVKKFMSDQVQQEQIIKVDLRYAMILLKSFLVHPDHIDNIQKKKQADHLTEKKEH